MKDFHRTQRALIYVNSLRVILELFTSTFLTSYIISMTPDNILGQGLMNVGLFYVSWFSVYIVLYFSISYLVDKSNRVSFLRIGIIVNALLLSALVLWGKTIAKWIFFAGALCGTSDAFYYSSYLVLKNELNSTLSIKNYNILTVVATNIIKVIVPTILGALIDISSYQSMAIYVVVLTFIQFGLSYLIKSKKPANSQFELKKYFSYLKENPDIHSKIKYTYINAVLAGFKNTYKIIVVILTIYTFKTNLSLGLFTSAFSIITILLLLLYKIIDNKPHVNKFFIYLLIGILPFISCLVFIFYINKWTLIVYNFFLTIAIYFSDYFGSMERDAIIKFTGHEEYVSEHQFLIELCTALTRILSYSIFILVGLTNSIVAFKIMLVLLLATNPLKFLTMYKQRTIRKNFETTLTQNEQNEQLKQNKQPE